MKTDLQPQIMTQAELFRKMGRGLAERCVAAGWIPVRNKIGGTIVYAVEDWRRAESRILEGEQPQG